MQNLDWLQLFLFLAIVTAITKPLGLYVSKVLSPQEKTPLHFLFGPLERVTYKLCGINVKKEHSWKEYLCGVLAFSFVSLLFTYLLLACQQFFPLNPMKLGALTSDLNFNTSVSFTTNTNWQSYSSETTMSYFSQMIPLVLQNFVSPAVGLAVAAALVRGIARHSSHTLGNFWVDLVRIIYYLLLPLSFFAAVFLVGQGTPQNFSSYTKAITLESEQEQIIVQGPIASRESIKMIGTNGGGYTSANSAHPYENPTPVSNFLQILFILAIPAAQTYYFGREINNQKHGWCVYATMAIIFVFGVIVCSSFEAKGNPQFAPLRIEMSGGNMEGKEQRIGIFGSALFATATTSASCGAVNSMHDSYTPIGGLVPMLNMQLGEIIWGGVGAGLYSMLVFIILSVFTAGLIIGKAPEYVGKRIEAFDIKLAIFSLIPFILVILECTAWASASEWGLSALGNQNAHGFSEILYAYSSASTNNGSAFAGLSTNTPWWNVTLGMAMLIGRFLTIVPIMALAGSLARKKSLPMGMGSFPVTGITFIALLISVIFLIGALCFLPALIMGPFLEQFSMNTFQLF